MAETRAEELRAKAPDPREVQRAQAIVAAFNAPDPEQAADQERILRFLDDHQDALLRTCLPGHLTASCLLLDASRERVLLHHHRKLDLWLQFGGHADGEGDLGSVARRELLEESGINPSEFASEPFDLDIHLIPAHKSEPAHEHLDVRYLAIAPQKATFVRSEESISLQWFTGPEALALGLDRSLARMVESALG